MTQGGTPGRRGDWCVNSLGKKFWPLDPSPDAVDIRDIAHCLALMCRFHGTVRSFYSIAQHCVLASCFGPQEIALELLLHDAAETYVTDLPRPIKRSITPEFIELEQKWMAAIDEALGLGGRLVNMPDEAKEVDNRMLFTEKRDLLPPCPDDWLGQCEPFPTPILPWGPSFAEQAFLLRFKELRRGHGTTMEAIGWCAEQHSAFEVVRRNNLAIAAAMRLVDKGELACETGLKIACLQLARQVDDCRKYLNVKELTRPVVIQMPGTKDGCRTAGE